MKRYFILIISALLIFSPLEAERKKVGLVLGGGGAKGAAHVGVLKVLEEAGIPIDYIAGTSIGAIVGGMYSIGHTVNELDSMFRTQDWGLLFSDNVNRRYQLYSAKENYDKYLFSLSYNIKQKKEQPTGLITGQNIYNLFSNMTIGYHEVESFNNLPISFSCVAVDLVTGKEAVLNKGSLPTAMRASMAIPGVFEPVLLDSMVLIDGGMLNNIPADVVLDMGAEIVIGIDLSTGWRSADDVKKISGMIDQMTIMMQHSKYEMNKNSMDICINPGLNGLGPASFSHKDIDYMINRGEEAARECWDNLMLLKKEIYGGENFEEVKRVHTYSSRDSIELAKISFKGISDNNENWIRKRIPIKENTTVSIQDIDKSVGVLYGTDLFSQVEYQLNEVIPHDIIFVLKNKPLNNLNIGLRFDSEEFASILLNTTINHQFMRGAIFSVTGRLNKIPYLYLTEQFGGVHNMRFGISYLLKYNDFSLYEKTKRVDTFSFISQSAEIYHSGFSRNVKYRFGLHYDYFHYDEDVRYNYFKESALRPEGFFNYFAAFTFDNRDQIYYPTRGLYTNLNAQLYTDNMITYNGDIPFFSLAYDLNGAIRFSDRVCLLPSLQTRFILGEETPLIYQNYMGGELNGRHLHQQISFSGIRQVQAFDNTLLVAKSALRCRIGSNQYISLSGEYANNSHNFDILNSRHVWGTALQYSYNSILGPIGLQVNYSNYDKRFNVYVNVGYNF